MGAPGPRRMAALLRRTDLPSTFERWRVTLPAGSERPTDAAEWAGAFACIEAGRIEVHCTRGGSRTFEEGDLLALGWLPLRTIRNAGPGEARILAIRRRGPRPRDEFLEVGRARAPTARKRRERGDEMPNEPSENGQRAARRGRR